MPQIARPFYCAIDRRVTEDCTVLADVSGDEAVLAGFRYPDRIDLIAAPSGAAITVNGAPLYRPA